MENPLIPPQVIRESDILDLYSVITNSLENGIQTEITNQKIRQVLNNANDQDDVVNLLADTLVQIDIETDLNNKQHRESFTKLVKSMIQTGLLPKNIAIERLEVDTSAQVGLIPDKKQFTTLYNRLRTRLYFKQKKFDLLREENEGFARIITQLFELNANNSHKTLDSIREIIGRYRVDPNRVLDLILETFEHNPRDNIDLYVDFLHLFYKNSQKITQLIVLKLRFYATYKNDQTSIPQSFYKLIAIFIHKEILDIDDIYPHLTPSDAKILGYHKRLVDEAKVVARKYAMAVVGEEKQIKSVKDSLSDEERYMFEIDNQKINICKHLIDLGDWDQATQLAKRLPEFYCFSDRRVAKSACDLIQYLIDPIYREFAFSEAILCAKIKPLPNRKIAHQQIKSINQLQTKLFPMLTALGPFLSANTNLLIKIIRILKHLVSQKRGSPDPTSPESPMFYSILDVINESILPATSLSGSNSFLARELWTLIRNFKYHIRYKLYYNWRDEGSNPVMLRNRGRILLMAKHHMKRLSKETLRFTARHIGKLCYPNPVITLNYILIQIQSYDNLINLVVEALKFLPPIALDALIYCILEALSDPQKNKKSFDGMALAQWLTSLSTFSASIISKYKVEFTGFLEYIGHQLKAGNSLDLILLTDLIQKMTGIETIQAITEDRVEALMGGDILRTECAYFNQIKNTRKSSARLKDTLIESGLAMPLCILMAQLRDSLFFDQKDKTPLKLVGKLYDQCQETLVQYGVFLSMNLGIDDYINFLPPLDKLITEHKLDPDSAFFLARPMIFHKIKSKFLELRESAARAMTVEEGESPELSPQSLGIKFVEAARSVIDPLAVKIQPSLTEKYGTSSLNVKLFVIFWTLSMSDIEVPVNCYDREIQRLKANLSEISKLPDEDPKRRKEKDRCNNLIQKLKQEQADQIEHANYVKMYLESEKNNLFRESHSVDNVYLEGRQFVQHCPFARSTLTAYDANYSARFLFFLHELKVEDYPTIICLDRLLCDLTYMIGACTENEASHYGRFLCNLLKTTAHWHSSPTIYSEQCEQFPGSIINIENAQHITYENYRDICYKWHYRLTRAFTVALGSNNYIQIRNALIVMIGIIDYYPVIKHFAKGIRRKVGEVRDSEKDSRQDLYARATGYAGKLDEKKPLMIPEGEFHVVDVTTQSSSSTSRPSSKTRPASPPSSHSRERHSSSSSRKRARHN